MGFLIRFFRTRLLFCFAFWALISVFAAIDSIPPKAICSLRDGQLISCAGAHYPSSVLRLRNISGLILLSEEDCAAPKVGVEDASKTILMMRRGSCSFVVKAEAAARSGFAGLVIGDSL